MERFMKLRVLDGDKTIGGTKLCLEDSGTTLLLDFGLNYSVYGTYFEEFMRPRSSRGLRDLWELGLIPKVNGIYRDDLFPPDFAPRSRLTLRPDALLISHAHMDHVGMLGTLRQDLPLVGSAITAAIMKSMQDTGKGDSWSEMAYIVPKLQSTTDRRALCSAGTSVDALARPFFATGPLTNDLSRLWNSPPNPSTKARGLQPAMIQGNLSRIGDLNFSAHALDHSIPGCLGFVIETSEGPVVYSGDLRLHGKGGASTLDFVERLAADRPRLLICEGTRLSRSSQRTVTEAEVAERITDLVAASAGRLVIGDFGGRHVERLCAFANAAREHGRQFVVTAKDAHLLESIAAAEPSLDVLADPSILIYDKLHARMDGWEQALRQRYQGRFATSADIRQFPGDFVIALSYWDCGEFVDLEPERGVYIYASSEAYSADQRSSLWRLTQWLARWRMKLHGFRWQGDADGTPIFGDRLNASGHIGGPDLAWLLAEVRPEFVLPVHTTEPAWFSELLQRTSTRVVTANSSGMVVCQ
jgi:ribonuclease J